MTSKIFEDTTPMAANTADYNRFRPYTKPPETVVVTQVPDKFEPFPMFIAGDGDRRDAMDVVSVIRPRRGHGY